MPAEIPVTQARADFAELVNRVGYGGERVVMTRHGKPLVALVSAADLRRLEQLDALEAGGGSAVSHVAETAVLAEGERPRFAIAAEAPRPDASR
jgi:prevent-host-death family protein